MLVEDIPTICSNGHWLADGVQAGWLPCECREAGPGHRTWHREVCHDVTYNPPHDPDVYTSRFRAPDGN